MRLWDTLDYEVTIIPQIRKIKAIIPDAMVYPTGSRYICSPPVMTTDVDLIVHSYRESTKGILRDNGYKESVATDYILNDARFTCWRKGMVNVILSASDDFVLRYRAATHYCKVHNIRKKWIRIVVHGVFRTGDPEQLTMHGILPIKHRELMQTLCGPYKAAMYAIYLARYESEFVTCA